jgi:hypothetical protein
MAKLCQKYVVVIDCQKDRSHWGLFSKWHEIAHLLLDEHQAQHIFVFRKGPEYRRDPKEILADRVAETFYKPIERAFSDDESLERCIGSPFTRPFRAPCLRPPRQPWPWRAHFLLWLLVATYLSTGCVFSLWAAFVFNNLLNNVPLDLGFFLKWPLACVPFMIGIDIMLRLLAMLGDVVPVRPFCESCPRRRDNWLSCPRREKDN